MFDSTWQDVRHALRSLRRAPGFTIAVVITLALGIGANTAIFSLLDAVMFKPLPIDRPGELFLLSETAPDQAADTQGGTGRLVRFSYPRFRQMEEAVAARGMLAAMTRVVQFTVRTSNGGASSAVQAQLVSGSYFGTLRVPAALGRLFTHEDTRQIDAHPWAVISHGYWQRQFAATPDVVGRQIVVNGTAITIVGVAEASFTGLWTETPVDLWLPLSIQHALHYRMNVSASNSNLRQPWMPQTGISWLNVIGRVAGGDVAGVRPALEAAYRPGLLQYADEVFGNESEIRTLVLAQRLQVLPFSRGFSGLRSRFSDALVLLAALVVMVLLVACANIANLLLARGVARQREVAVRASLGATRLRLARQSLTEGVVLAALGGAAGLVMGGWISGLLAGMVLDTSPDLLPPGFSPDLRVVGFTALVSLATVLVFGVVPAFRFTRTDVQAALAAGGRGSVGHASLRGMRPLVAAQLALSLLVVVAAVLFGRSLVNLSQFDPGFDRHQLVAVGIDPPLSGYSQEQIPSLHQRLLDAVGAIPGVTSAAVSMMDLGGGGQAIRDFQFEGYQSGPIERESQWNQVGPRYFSTTGMALVEGREFDERDTAQRPPVAVVNEAVVRRYFGGRSPLGKHLGEDRPDTEIVGVVRDANVRALRETPIPTIYLSSQRLPVIARSLVVRVSGDPGRMVPLIQQAVERSEPNLLIYNVRTLDEQLERNVAQETIVAYLASAFGIVALLMACLGLYGVLSYMVARRTHETGVRLALGATSFEVMQAVVREGMSVVVVGMGAGVALALWAGRFVETLLFEVSPADPRTYVAIVATLGAVALAACYVPARRASRIDPMAALRSE